MKLITPKKILLLQNLARRSAIAFGFVICMVILLTTTNPGIANAAGGAGGGGTGTGGSGGHQSKFGFSWAKYSSGGGGPTDGFKQGGWYGPGGPSETCQGANADSVLVFINLNNYPSAGGTARGYNYQTVYDTFWNQPTAGQIWDQGKATTVPKADAENAFNSLTPAERGGLTFGVDVAWVCYDSTPQPDPTYDGTISITKYGQDKVASDSSSPGNTEVGLDHQPPDNWSPNSNSNSANFDNIWVNPSVHESNTKGNYQSYIIVPKGWKVVRATINVDGVVNAPLKGSCDVENGKCFVQDVTVKDKGEAPHPTWVDFFMEPNVNGFIDEVCPTNKPTDGSYNKNGKFWGWVKDTYNNGGASQVDAYIDGGPGNSAWGKRLTANKPREAAVGGNYGFEDDVPDQFFDGNSHTLRVYVLRDGGGFGDPLYQLSGSPKTFTCPPPTGDVRCLPSEESGDGIDYIQGWAFDPRKTQGPSFVHIYVDSTPGNTTDPDAKYNNGNVFGTIKLTPGEIIARKNEGYRGVDDNGLYRFKVAIPDALHDGENHIIRVYQITEDPASNPELKYVLPNGPYIEIGPNKCGTSGTVEKWYWPWLQTQNGDVINRGSITGQLTADPQPNNNDRPGARLTTAKDKEAEYLVISMAGGGNPFCSTYEYILTNTAATTGDCKNGSGYGNLKLDDLANEAGDTVFNGVVDKFNANGGGVAPNNAKCKPYNTQGALPANLDTGQGAGLCRGGTIFKFSGDSLSGFSVISGRNTVFKDGNLKITGNITIPSDKFSSADPRLQPNLAIVVNGDVYIDKSVTRIDSAIYATGKIYTCSSGSATPFEQCNLQLSINGMLTSRNGYDFRRTFANDGRQPAELIKLSGQTVAFPPPGISILDIKDSNNDVMIDTGEYQPKF